MKIKITVFHVLCLTLFFEAKPAALPAKYR